MPNLLERPFATPDDPRRRWTRTEYRHFIETDILEDGQYELVLGEIWKKMGHGLRHTIVVMRIIEALTLIFGFRRIQIQSSLSIGADDPEPDAALLAHPLDYYLETPRTDADVLLVVEASDSTLRPDLTHKVIQYGSVGIPEYWVVDIPNRLFHVFRQPYATGYAEEIVLTADDEVRPLAAPDNAVRVADLLP